MLPLALPLELEPPVPLGGQQTFLPLFPTSPLWVSPPACPPGPASPTPSCPCVLHRHCQDPRTFTVPAPVPPPKGATHSLQLIAPTPHATLPPVSPAAAMHVPLGWCPWGTGWGGHPQGRGRADSCAPRSGSTACHACQEPPPPSDFSFCLPVKAGLSTLPGHHPAHPISPIPGLWHPRPHAGCSADEEEFPSPLWLIPQGHRYVGAGTGWGREGRWAMVASPWHSDPSFPPQT